MQRKDLGLRILAALLFVCTVMGLGAALTAQGLAPWYQTLVLPSYAPPGYVIGYVWTALYALLAVAIVLSWNAQGKAFFRALGPLYLLNGALNILWSFVFFGMHDVLSATVTAGILAFSVLVLIFANFTVSKVAAVLLIPYFLWVSFATVLNAQIAELNGTHAAPSGTPTLPMSPDKGEVIGKPAAITFTLSTGATKQVDSHLSLTLNAVNDSRCPTDEGVYCIWAGELSPQLTAVLDGKSSEVRLGTTTAKTADVGPYHLTLVDAGLDSAKIKVDLP